MESLRWVVGQSRPQTCGTNLHVNPTTHHELAPWFPSSFEFATNVVQFVHDNRNQRDRAKTLWNWRNPKSMFASISNSLPLMFPSLSSVIKNKQIVASLLFLLVNLLMSIGTCNISHCAVVWILQLHSVFLFVWFYLQLASNYVSEQNAVAKICDWKLSCSMSDVCGVNLITKHEIRRNQTNRPLTFQTKSPLIWLWWPIFCHSPSHSQIAKHPLSMCCLFVPAQVPKQFAWLSESLPFKSSSLPDLLLNSLLSLQTFSTWLVFF